MLFKKESNFAEAFKEDEKKVLRKRMIGMILATDMADHMSQQQVLDHKIKSRDISREKNNGHLLIDGATDQEKFTS